MECFEELKAIFEKRPEDREISNTVTVTTHNDSVYVYEPTAVSIDFEENKLGVVTYNVSGGNVEKLMGEKVCSARTTAKNNLITRAIGRFFGDGDGNEKTNFEYFPFDAASLDAIVTLTLEEHGNSDDGRTELHPLKMSIKKVESDLDPERIKQFMDTGMSKGVMDNLKAKGAEPGLD